MLSAGAVLSTTDCKTAYVDALVVGEDYLLSCSRGGGVMELVLPDPQAHMKDAQPQAAQIVRRWDKRWRPRCMQVRFDYRQENTTLDHVKARVSEEHHNLEALQYSAPPQTILAGVPLHFL